MKMIVENLQDNDFLSLQKWIIDNYPIVRVVLERG